MQELKVKLNELEITVTEDTSGEYTAFTTKEPLFCLTNNNLGDLKIVVEGIITSYAKTFYNVDDIDVEVRREDNVVTIPSRKVVELESWSPHVPVSNEQLEYA